MIISKGIVLLLALFLFAGGLDKIAGLTSLSPLLARWLWILPMVCGKMAGGNLAVALAFILPGMGRKKSAVRTST